MASIVVDCLLALLTALPAAGGEPEVPANVRTGFNAVWADGADGAWAVGDLGVVAETRDHGKTWHVLAFPVKTALLAVWRDAEGDLFVAGEKGVVLRGGREGRWRRLRVARKILSGLEYDRSQAGPEIRSLWGDGRSIYLVGGEPGAALCLRARKQATVLDGTFSCEFDDPFAVWVTAGTCSSGVASTIVTAAITAASIAPRMADVIGHGFHPRGASHRHPSGSLRPA